MSLETPRDLFVHELSDLLSAENIFLGILEEMSDLSEHADAKKAYTDHHKETKGQIDRLNKIFKILGEEPEQVTCYGAEGLRKEHDSLKEENPEGVVKELGMLLGADKSEHYEISSYRNLMNVARATGEDEVADLLSETLAEEEEADKKVRSITRSLGSELKPDA